MAKKHKKQKPKERKINCSGWGNRIEVNHFSPWEGDGSMLYIAKALYGWRIGKRK